MSTWIGEAVRTGILTSKYPDAPATADEVPETARPPVPSGGLGSFGGARPLCPTGAISDQELDRGKCIRCARCTLAGFEFRGEVESATRSRAGLAVGPTGSLGPTVQDASAPLVGFSRSVHVFMVDVGSCNACNLEVMALSNPFYDSNRLGIFFTNSPRHADVLVVVGVPTDEMVEPLRRAYDAMPEPKSVIAVGVCPISGGAFSDTPGLWSSLEEILPVDVFVPGCPPTPVNVLDGILRAVGRGRGRKA